MKSDESGLDLQPARYPVRLGLPSGDNQSLIEAAKAIRQEAKDGSRHKRLHCRKVDIFAERDRGAVYVLHVEKSIEFDWTWEGARAFRFESSDDEANEHLDFDVEESWSGEILEVDERNGCLFVGLDDPEMTPTVGAFFVRPFEFLAALDAIYNADEWSETRRLIPARLAATTGDIHPPIDDQRDVGLEDLRAWWRYSWAVLWGPPGTGKTWTTGRQIASVLEDPGERILVVSTTNKATDAVALSIGEAVKEICPGRLSDETIRRIGQGSARRSFTAAGLDSLLQGTESETQNKIDSLVDQFPMLIDWEEKAFARKQIAELRGASGEDSNRIFLDDRTRVVVATAFKAISSLRFEMIRKMIDQNEAPFTTIFIDESGLISRIAAAALSLLASKRVVLVGDSKQLAPISRISRIMPPRQQTWLASSGLSHLDSIDEAPSAVHVLTKQYRMHRDVCDVVSSYQYNGFLSTATEVMNRPSNLSPSVKDFSRAIWYVLDEEDADLVSIRAGRGPSNRSWVRDITASVLQSIFSDDCLRNANGLFISPFKGQAQVIGDQFVKWGLANWTASTVHSQQGSEADVVIFDSVNASSYTWPHDEWKRLVNVALSRAKEAVIVLASRAEMDEPYLRELAVRLRAARLVRDADGMRWQDVSPRSPHAALNLAASNVAALNLAETPAGYQTTSCDGSTPVRKNATNMGEQFGQRKSMQPILSSEQQRLTNLKLDGKPRLIRGVAGSGKSVVLCNWLAKTAKRLQSEKDVRIWAVYANRSLHQLLRDSVESAWNGLDHETLFRRPEFPWHLVELIHVKDILAGLLPTADLSLDAFGFDYDRAAEEFLNRHDVEEFIPRCSALFIDEAQDMGPSVLRLLLSVVEQSDAEDTNSRAAHIFYDNAQNVYDTKTPKWSDFGLNMRGRSAIMRESFRSTMPITELAVNVLDQLSDNRDRKDQRELIELGLLERVIRNDRKWLRVGFNQIDGPAPIYHRFDSLSEQMAAIASHLKHLILNDGISPTDICIIYNGRADESLENLLAPRLTEFGVELSIQKRRAFERKSNTLVATTPQSIKGYEAEVVIIPCVDQYVAAEGKLLEHSLYVAMTRARSLLAIYGIEGGSHTSRRIGETIRSCLQNQLVDPSFDVEFRPDM